MKTERLLPRVRVRDTGPSTPVKRKQSRIPTMGRRNVPVRYSDAIVAGVKFDLLRKPVKTVALEWGLDPAIVGAWNRGVSRIHVEPAEWPASISKKEATK